MTEKDYNPKQKQKKAMKKAAVASKAKTQNEQKPKSKSKPAEKTEDKKPEKNESKSKKESKPRAKKEEAVIISHNLPISTKKAAGICRFIKGKKIGDAIRELEKVSQLKKAVPMKGEVPHRKGKIMSGSFPERAAKEFITVLKGLAGNAVLHEIDDPVIVEAIANIGSRPYGRFGRVRRKRTHLKIAAREKKKPSSKSKKSKKKKKKIKNKKQSMKKSKKSKGESKK